MLIDEKGLVRAIKKVYSSSGYVVINHGAQLSIYADAWYLRCDWDKLPRKVLALIVEHTGALPGSEALSVQKKDEPQIMMPDIVGNDIAGWLERQEQHLARHTPLQWHGLRVYQQENGKCYGVDGEDLEIVDASVAEYNDATIAGESRMKWEQDGELIILYVCGATYFSATSATSVMQSIWDGFEHIQLNKPEE